MTAFVMPPVLQLWFMMRPCHADAGIRNTVGITFHPDTGEMWYTSNGSDHLGGESALFPVGILGMITMHSPSSEKTEREGEGAQHPAFEGIFSSTSTLLRLRVGRRSRGRL